MPNQKQWKINYYYYCKYLPNNRYDHAIEMQVNVEREEKYLDYVTSLYAVIYLAIKYTFDSQCLTNNPYFEHGKYLIMRINIQNM